MHHEVELGVVIGKTGRDIKESDAESYIAGYSTSLYVVRADDSPRNRHDGKERPGCSEEEGSTLVNSQGIRYLLPRRVSHLW